MTDKVKGKNYTHGLTGTRVYKTWESMKAGVITKMITNMKSMAEEVLKYAMNG